MTATPTSRLRISDCSISVSVALIDFRTLSSHGPMPPYCGVNNPVSGSNDEMHRPKFAGADLRTLALITLQLTLFTHHDGPLSALLYQFIDPSISAKVELQPPCSVTALVRSHQTDDEHHVQLPAEVFHHTDAVTDVVGQQHVVWLHPVEFIFRGLLAPCRTCPAGPRVPIG